MSVQDAGVVDYVAMKEADEEVVLAISDHLVWNGDDHQQEHMHMELLQEKINRYLGFIENGELIKAYPAALGRKVVILVLAKYPLSQSAERFYEAASSVISNAGFELRFQLGRR